MLKIYSDRSHYDSGRRAHLVSVLRPFWKDFSISDEEREQIYGDFVQNICMVENPGEADICILPMNWLHYLKNGLLNKANSFVELAATHEKRVAIWNGGDNTAHVPFSHAYIFAASGYESRRSQHQFALPAFINDPVTELGRSEIIERPFRTRPTIGFCGQASDVFWKRVSKPLYNLWKTFKSRTGLSYLEPHPIMPPTRLRAKALNILKNSSLLETTFAIRTQYLGGNERPWQVLRQEFLDNIVGTDYTLCIRGTGNYSQRLYETLALGRIPIFVNTDCILPYDQHINWKDYSVWIDQSELAQLPAKVAVFHESLGPHGFKTLQHECRKLWKDWLSYAGFHSQFEKHFGDSSKN